MTSMAAVASLQRIPTAHLFPTLSSGASCWKLEIGYSGYIGVYRNQQMLQIRLFSPQENGLLILNSIPLAQILTVLWHKFLPELCRVPFANIPIHPL